MSFKSFSKFLSILVDLLQLLIPLVLALLLIGVAVEGRKLRAQANLILNFPSLAAKVNQQATLFNQFSSLLINICCLIACLKNRFYAKPVKYLLITSCIARMIFVFYYFCNNLSYNIFETLPDSLYNFFLVFVSVALASRHVAHFAQLGLSVNRFLAISFEGRYYQRLNKYPLIYVLAAIVSGFVYGYVISKWITGFDISTVWIAGSIAFDVSMFFKLYNKRKSKSISMAERVLLIQMIGTNVTSGYPYYVEAFVLYFLSSADSLTQTYFYYSSRFFLYGGGQSWDGAITIYTLRRAERKKRVESQQLVLSVTPKASSQTTKASQK